jgi:protein-disulfide isomerase
MTKYHLLIIPIIIGIVTGAFLAFYPESESDLLTSTKLIEGGSPIMGDSDAPITILEWGDYQCTYCYKFHQNTLDEINENFIKTGKVKLVFKDYPLNGPDSVLAAEASHCAHDQNKYWEYHNELYSNWGGERTGWITPESLNRFGNTVNLNMQDFNTCLNEHKHKDKIISMYEFGKEIGIDATPSFLIFDDQKIVKIRGNQPLEVFLKTFDEM